MVDPNPARGMPAQLQRYWLVGKGAAKIRWNVPGDFKRCVRAIRKYFPKEPEGLCNILHTKATGGPPGHGSAEHAASFEAVALLAAQPVLGSKLWSGPLAPVNAPTGEPSQVRIFEPGALKNRPMPLPLRHRRMEGQGHQGAVTVGRIMGLTIGPDEDGNDWVYAWGDWLDDQIIPEVTEARYLVDQGVAGASLDPGGRVRAMVNPENGEHRMMEYTMGGATLVAIPAFSATRLFNLDEDGNWPDDDMDMDASSGGVRGVDCGCGAKEEMAAETTFNVNSDGWRGLPLAPREAVFDNDDAVRRISEWSNVGAGGTDVRKLTQAFMWRDPSRPETDPTSYRLPVGDIVNGRLTLVFHAIYAAAALLSGAHGGLPGIPDEDKMKLRAAISDIYPEMAKAFNDSSIRAPWDRPANVEARADAKGAKEFAVADSPKEPYGDVTYADPGYQKDGKKRYPLDNEKHIRAAWTYINQEGNAGEYTPAQLKAIKARIAKAMKKLGAEVADDEYSMAFAYPLEPPAAWFQDPHLDAKTPITVEASGHVYGHLAAWGECHRDVTQRSCVMAPQSQQEYAPFHLGQVVTAEGTQLRVGKIVMDTRHADIALGYSAAAIHYDHTGDEVAVVRAGEDEFGIWVSGSLVPEATPAKAAKLRRSPLSGDWRRIDNNLELTAALAVNVPAFPVYAMEGEDQTALVAAGSVTVDEHELELEQEDRAWELHAILEEDEQLAQWERAQQFAALFAADGEPVPEVPSEDPVYGTPGMLQRQLDAQFTIIEDTEGGEPGGDEPEPGPDNGRDVVPVGAAPQPGTGV